MAILALFQRTLKDLTTPEFGLIMRRFLGVARTHPLNYGLSRTSLLAPIVALALLRGSAGGPESVLVLAGLLAFVSRFGNRVAVLRPLALQRLFGRSSRRQ